MKMELTTTQLDPTVAMNAVNDYKAKNYRSAMTHLTDILDFEPKNWQARLLLGVCFLRIAQPGAAHRAFAFVQSNCTDSDLKTRASNALQLVSEDLAKFSQRVSNEFGMHQAQMAVARVAAIEALVG